MALRWLTGFRINLPSVNSSSRYPLAWRSFHRKRVIPRRLLLGVLLNAACFILVMQLTVNGTMPQYDSESTWRLISAGISFLTSKTLAVMQASWAQWEHENGWATLERTTDNQKSSLSNLRTKCGANSRNRWNATLEASAVEPRCRACGVLAFESGYQVLAMNAAP